jgi:hypothetical protein
MTATREFVDKQRQAVFVAQQPSAVTITIKSITKSSLIQNNTQKQHV